MPERLEPFPPGRGPLSWPPSAGCVGTDDRMLEWKGHALRVRSKK